VALSETLSRDHRWRRILPVAFVMYIISYVDRTNIALALPSMISDLHMEPAQAGSAAGVFFWGYLLLQIPGGHLAQRWSAKKVVSVLLVFWGVSAVATGLISSGWQFWLMRLLLGVAEGGVFPATIILLANWFPPLERARANAYWMLCQPLAIVLSSPLSGWILGRWNWRVLLIAEGALPFLWLWVWNAVIQDRPAAVVGLSEPDRRQTTRVPKAAFADSAGRPQQSLLRSLADPRIPILIAVCFFLNVGGYGYLFWLPTAMAGARKIPASLLGILFAIPYLLAGVGMILNSRHSDRTQERRLHVAIPLLLGGLALGAGVLASGEYPYVSFTFVCLAGACFFSCMGPLWSIPTENLSRDSSGAGAGLVNAIGNLGGYFGPLLVGALSQRTGDFKLAFGVLSGSLVLGGLLTLLLKLNPPEPQLVGSGGNDL
jgi:sugar phosphate permease